MQITTKYNVGERVLYKAFLGVPYDPNSSFDEVIGTITRVIVTATKDGIETRYHFDKTNDDIWAVDSDILGRVTIQRASTPTKTRQTRKLKTEKQLDWTKGEPNGHAKDETQVQACVAP